VLYIWSALTHVLVAALKEMAEPVEGGPAGDQLDPLLHRLSPPAFVQTKDPVGPIKVQLVLLPESVELKSAAMVLVVALESWTSKDASVWVVGPSINQVAPSVVERRFNPLKLTELVTVNVDRSLNCISVKLEANTKS